MAVVAFARVPHFRSAAADRTLQGFRRSGEPGAILLGVFLVALRYIGDVRSMHVAVEGSSIMWNQVYDPFNNWIFSTLSAALPVVTLLVLIASNKVKAHIAAIIALIVANLVAIFIFTMPSGLALRATVLGAVTGFFPIGWIVLDVIFLYRLTVEKGTFETLQTTI